jgi:hypothetical protein
MIKEQVLRLGDGVLKETTKGTDLISSFLYKFISFCAAFAEKV